MGTFAKSAVAANAGAGSSPVVSGGRVLSNGRYTVLLTHAGTGVSRCGAHALTRWIADRVEDRSGFVIYVRDLDSGRFASIGLEPAGRGAERYESAWTPGELVLTRRGDELEARMDVCVLPGADVELRRVTITNLAKRVRRVELTSALEIVLHHPAADAGHPAFAKLFVQTEHVPERGAILARRRPRGNDETHPVMAHALLGARDVTCETDRVRFLGRGATWAEPDALRPGATLSGTTGNVLDPIASLRCSFELAPGASAERTFVLAVGADRDAALAPLAALDSAAIVRAFGEARAHAEAGIAKSGVSEADAAGLQALLVAMLVGHPALRAPAEAMLRTPEYARPLAPLGFSPSRPLVVARLRDPQQLDALRAARRLWGTLGVAVDVAVLPGSAPIAGASEPGVRVLTRDEVSDGGLWTLASAASLWLDEAAIADVARTILATESGSRPSTNGHASIETTGDAPGGSAEPLRHFNGYGGFNEAGDEYVIRMPWRAGRGLLRPPLPWVNVIATPSFGFIASETGAGATWSVNSREHRLTPWSNDPVLDPHGEAIYLRDEDSGAWWSPLAGPAPQPVAHETRHGFGYTITRHAADGLEQEVTLFAHVSEPVKIARVRIGNRGAKARRLSAWAYQRLVLGVLPEDSGRTVVTADDAASSLLTATNAAAGEFATRVAFAAAVVPDGARERSVCGERATFLGLGGSPAHPAAVSAGDALDGRVGAGLDPCFAERWSFDVAPGADTEITFLLGECADAAAVRALVAALREPGAVSRSLEAAVAFWRDFVSGVRVRTPEPALDLMVNGWLAYQTLACRIWGRTAFYQSGGAFGFRDQLQDAASLLHLDPALAREQILLHAAHQFVEGDVLHWWHPPLSKGIRTRFADDLLWLPLLAAYYVGATGDWSVLDERARFLSADLLEEGEDERFLEPRDSGTSADVYEHCCRAIDRSLVRGSHGLPLFGTGDWNDGMNRVGREGRGESVWMGFFLHAILGDFAGLCARRGDHERAERYARFRDQLRVALNDGGWDGEWYRRAYYDNGEPMGSKSSDECRIDGLAQAWAVISKAAPAERAEQAMDAVMRDLVSERDGLIRLLTPAFQDTPNDPGYIKGYVPGVRENGGQYTHASLWVVRAFAELGRRDLSARLLAMLSPVSHTSDPERLAIYRTEPYVIVADVYGEPPHVGRGGWTWYTGSAGWMLRVAIESVFGIRLVRGETLRIKPCTPAGWGEYAIEYRVPGGRTTYDIVVRGVPGPSGEVVHAALNGQPVAIQRGAATIPLTLDGGRYRVDVQLGSG